MKEKEKKDCSYQSDKSWKIEMRGDAGNIYGDHKIEGHHTTVGHHETAEDLPHVNTTGQASIYSP